MKTLYLSKKVRYALTVSAFAISAAFVQAQTNLYFNPSENQSDAGGGGTWDSTTSDWYNNTTDVPFGSGNNAHFEGTAGTVYVNNAGVTANEIFTNTGYTIGAPTGDLVDPAGTITLALPNNSGANVLEADGTVAPTINAPINLVVPDATNAIYSAYINNYTGATMTLNSTIQFTGGQVTASPNFHSLNISGNTTFNGTIGNTTAQAVFLSFSNGTDEITSTANISAAASVSLSGATVYIDPNTHGSPGQWHDDNGSQFLTKGAVTTGTETIYINTSGNVIGGSTADTSTINNTIGDYGSGPTTFTAAQNGRVNIAGQIYTGNQEVINGAGVVAFTNAEGNGYTSGYRDTTYNNMTGFNTPTTASNSDIGTDVQHGTLLIENTDPNTSATGAGANQPLASPGVYAGANDVVQIENVTNSAPVAVLGGTGYTQQQVIALGVNSTISPGDMDQYGNSSIGTLHLDNGLSAVNGLTVNFQITPTAQDLIDVATLYDSGSGVNGSATDSLVLDGNVIFNLSGVINPTKIYTLVQATDGSSFDADSANYSFTGVPTGYQAFAYTTEAGGFEQLDVTFYAAAVPEPSTWLMLGTGAAVLLSLGRFRPARSQVP
jgi:hypothetical protein